MIGLSCGGFASLLRSTQTTTNPMLASTTLHPFPCSHLATASRIRAAASSLPMDAMVRGERQPSSVHSTTPTHANFTGAQNSYTCSAVSGIASLHPRGQNKVVPAPVQDGLHRLGGHDEKEDGHEHQGERRGQGQERKHPPAETDWLLLAVGVRHCGSPSSIQVRGQV